MPLLARKHCRITPSDTDGTRLLVMRFWPRGLKKTAFHHWHRDLAPTPELLTWCRSNRGQMDHTLFDHTWKTRYAEQMVAQSQLIDNIRHQHLAGEAFTLL